MRMPQDAEHDARGSAGVMAREALITHPTPISRDPESLNAEHPLKCQRPRIPETFFVSKRTTPPRTQSTIYTEPVSA